jgi:hypothetical protein
MQSRLYVDLRIEDEYQRGLEQLVDHVFNRYNSKPALGQISPEAATHESSAVVASRARGWVLVAGTGKLPEFTSTLASLSTYLGERLSGENYGLVTGGWSGVDQTVARAFAEGASARQLPLEDRLVQAAVREPAFPAGELLFLNRGEEEWSEPIRRADAVVFLGGIGGTGTTGEIAWQMRKPVLPLADTGGDAKRLYLHTLKMWGEFQENTTN